MLPAWATVLIAAISAGAGVLGGWLATKTRIDYDRDENVRVREHERAQQAERLKHETAADWRDRRLRAADDFSTGVEQALLGVRALIDAPRNTDFRERALELVDEAVARVARIKLLFGETSQSTRIATDLLPELDLTRKMAELERDGVWDKLENTYNLHRKFNEAALDAIQRDEGV